MPVPYPWMPSSPASLAYESQAAGSRPSQAPGFTCFPFENFLSNVGDCFTFTQCNQEVRRQVRPPVWGCGVVDGGVGGGVMRVGR